MFRKIETYRPNRLAQRGNDHRAIGSLLFAALAAPLLLGGAPPASPATRDRNQSTLSALRPLFALSTKKPSDSCATHFQIESHPKKLRVEVWQENQRVPLCKNRWVLKKKPFVLKLRGHAGSASYWATPKKSELKKLIQIKKKLKKPLVSGKGYAIAITGMELQRRYHQLKVAPATASWFASKWVGDRYGGTAGGSRDYARWLKKKLGETPYFANFGRVYFPSAPRKKLRSYHLKKFKRLPKNKGVRGELPVSSISGKPISSFSRLHFAIFLERELGRAGFSELTWKRAEMVFK